MASRSVEVQLWPDCRYASRHTTPKARNAGKGNLIPNLTGLSGPASKRPRRAATTPRRPRPAPSSSSSKGRLQLRAQRTVAGCRGRMGACCDAVREAGDRLQHSAQLLRSRKELRECRSEDDPRIPHIRTFATKSCDCCFVQAPLALAGPV